MKNEYFSNWLEAVLNNFNDTSIIYRTSDLRKWFKDKVEIEEAVVRLADFNGIMV